MSAHLVEHQLVNHKQAVLGIDPGLSGAVVCLGHGQLEVRRDFKKLDDIAFAIRVLSKGADVAVMELVHAMPGQGVCSMFSFGSAAGVAKGACALSFPFKVEEVTPQKWQNFYRDYLKISREVDFDSKVVARYLFPSRLDIFKRAKDHNTADACLIAAWRLLAGSV